MTDAEPDRGYSLHFPTEPVKPCFFPPEVCKRVSILSKTTSLNKRLDFINLPPTPPNSLSEAPHMCFYCKCSYSLFKWGSCFLHVLSLSDRNSCSLPSQSPPSVELRPSQVTGYNMLPETQHVDLSALLNAFYQQQQRLLVQNVIQLGGYVESSRAQVLK